MRQFAVFISGLLFGAGVTVSGGKVTPQPAPAAAGAGASMRGKT